LISPARLVRWIRSLLQLVLLTGFAQCLQAALWVAVIYQVSQAKQAARHEAVVRSQALARVLSEHVSHILRQTDHATQLFKLKYEETGGRLRLAEFTRRGGLLDSVLPARLGLPIALVDKNGKVIDSANAFIGSDVAIEPWFRTVAENPADGAHFSTPLVEARNKKWQIQVTRRLNDELGRFAGMIVILIDPAFFIDDYDRLNVDDHGALVLLAPESGLAIGRVGENIFLSDRIDFTPSANSLAQGEVQPREPLDKILRVYGASDMPRFSLVAVVGMTEAETMATFERHRKTYYLISFAATILIVMVVAVLMRQSTELRRSIRTAHEAQGRLRGAVDASLDAFLILKAWPPGAVLVEDFIIADLNGMAADKLHHRRDELLGQRAFAMLPRYRQTGFFDSYVKVFKSGEPLEEEVEIHLDGEAPIWMHHQIVPIDGGVAVTSRDITARKEAEFKVRSNRSFLQSLVTNLPLLVYVKNACPDRFGVMMEWNKAAEMITGYAAERVLGKRMQDVFPPEFGLSSEEEERAMVANPAISDHPERPIHLADGSVRYLHVMSVPLLDEAGKVEYIMVIAEDITRRREQEQSLRASEAQMAAVANASPLGLVRANVYGQATYVNRRFETITGLTRAEAAGFGWFNALDPNDRDFLNNVFDHQRNSDEPHQSMLHFQRKDGTMVWATLKIAAIRIGYRIEGFVATIDDVTTLREAEMALRESESRLRTIADTMPAMVAYIDSSLVYRFHNLAYEREFGGTGGHMLGKTVIETVGAERYAKLKPHVEAALAGHTQVFEEYDETDGKDRALEVTYIPQLGADGSTVVGFHVMRHDITTQKREKKRLLKLSQLDPLTGLANRGGFMEKLESAMRMSTEKKQLMAVMYMDIDRFKPVNDTYGHNVGDTLLRAFSARLVHNMRASDTIARLGGDEFTIIMENIKHAEDASHTAAKIVAGMQMPFELDGVLVHITTSIGLAYFCGGPQDSTELLHEADMLLYQSKQAGRNTFRAGNPAMAVSS
jgi:diguanylate cyclase (GGDEF)-like protein/PAS domain S-box-containing protein